MLPVDFEQANFTFNKPKSMTDEECDDLRVYKGHDSNNTPCIVSKWQPSYEDIETIRNGESVYLIIAGHGMPPIALTTEDPFTPEKVNQ